MQVFRNRIRSLKYYYKQLLKFCYFEGIICPHVNTDYFCCKIIELDLRKWKVSLAREFLLNIGKIAKFAYTKLA